ncbi:MAG: acetyltransferase family protein [Saliniramus fredricksonii]|uniref:Acetyltransferase family protein n=1 Tax=Saliniramus fredricksonii TaxID=1653334 RepID=A0A0N8KEQ0_9HYPH|nr:GNAT family N-acetyltransferase [Saliniramus fredricksonii]KPQ11954.1 MAG: acetyltransferase family protein [Saliniramus fredricksonii]SCC81551.1 L-amino acid N-acyltransferase YncA [Saliniramus fredricksonii]
MSESAPIIRAAGPADLPAIRAIVEAAYSPYIERLGKKPGPMLNDYAAQIAAGRVHCLCDDEGVAGFTVLIPEESRFMLDNVAVADRARGRGYGRALMAFAEDAARQAGYRAITLYTHEKMHENRALYARLGYRETGLIREKGFARIYMEKSV